MIKEQTPSTTPIEDNTAVNIITIFLLIFLYPVGLIVMWLATKWKLWVKLLVSSVLLLMIFLGILAAVVLIAINPSGQFKKARDTQRKSDVIAIQQALISYRIENEYYPSTLTELIPDYMTKVPTDPSGDQYFYEILSSGTDYEICFTPESEEGAISNCVDSQGGHQLLIDEGY